MAGHPSPSDRKICPFRSHSRLAFVQCICVGLMDFGRFGSHSVGHPFAPALRMSAPMRTVYVLKNADTPPRFYTGLTADLKSRIEAHNAGHCSHTAKYRPWAVDVIIKFADETRALKFEKYLKSGSGVEFARRHLR
jgi:putative endonuclease